MTPYVCEGTIVRTMDGFIGRIVSINREAKTALLYFSDSRKTSIVTEKIKNLKVVSYREVE